MTSKRPSPPALSSRSRSISAHATGRSSALVISSASKIAGSPASARASATRWRCPPLSEPGRRRTIDGSSATLRSSACSSGSSGRQRRRPASARASSIALATDRCGSRAASGSCQHSCTRRRSGLHASAAAPTSSTPPNRSEPASPRSRPTSARASADLPAPEGPTSATASPGPSSRSTPRTTTRPPSATLRPRNESVSEDMSLTTCPPEHTKRARRPGEPPRPARAPPGAPARRSSRRASRPRPPAPPRARPPADTRGSPARGRG